MLGFRPFLVTALAAFASIVPSAGNPLAPRQSIDPGIGAIKGLETLASIFTDCAVSPRMELCPSVVDLSWPSSSFPMRRPTRASPTCVVTIVPLRSFLIHGSGQVVQAKLQSIVDGNDGAQGQPAPTGTYPAVQQYAVLASQSDVRAGFLFRRPSIRSDRNHETGDSDAQGIPL